MKKILKTIAISGLYSGLVFSGVSAQEHQHEQDEKTASIDISSAQMDLANIKVARLERRVINYKIYAPAEIKVNDYTSYLVSPRVGSIVLRRHVALGDHVEKGQKLVTLFSETVADAQARYNITRAEWLRVQKMGRQAVGDRRYIAAQSEFEATYGRLRAFGLTKQAIQKLSKKVENFGEYTLIAATAGAVLMDDFHQGQRVEAGNALMEVADEKELWVEARLVPLAQLHLSAGTQAQVKVGGNIYSAKVAQEAHIIDRQTRTRVVRLIVDNRTHQLHPGMFADVFFTFATEDPVLAVPEAALMRGADGDWIVFVEGADGKFKAHEVQLGRPLGKWREITGIAEGSKVVVEGAFFVSSQIAKGDFDVHNH